MSPTSRSVALEQLLRIEEEGAFAGLVGGTALKTLDLDADENGDGSMTTSSSSNINNKAGQGSTAEYQIRQLNDRDRRHVTEIVAGVTRWRRRLDYTLTHLPKPTNLDTMDPPLRVLLRMGCYELLQLRLPDHAINDYVELAKGVMHVGCGKVANGVLRGLARARESKSVPAPPSPAAGAAPAEYAEALAVGFSHPTWMVGRWLRQFGPGDTVQLLKHNNA